MRKIFVISLVLTLLIPLSLFAQKGSITGKVTNAKTGEALVGANLVIQGTALGAATGINGLYVIRNVPTGTFTLKVTFIGYDETSAEVQVTTNTITTANFELDEQIISGATITVLADRAKLQETPVAFTNVEKADMEARLGSQDIPLVLNTTPSVYATMQGGGAGDARVNVRGFNQRNVAIMINGVPINDMENGWVYWSNWDGVGDATSSIQMQRGLSAVNLATPSIGGTMNIITDPTALQTGVKFKQEVGSGAFLKSTLTAHSGLINDKYAFSTTLVRKTGDGVIDKTWTDAWAYYFGGSYQINKDNRLELYVVGAPQQHGQNRYRQNIGVYSASFAKDLNGYDATALTKFYEAGREYNQNWNTITADYNGKQYYNGKTHDRYDSGFINEIVNYYHKPIANLNWYSQLTEALSLYSTVYYSGGVGGGSGTYGDFAWDYNSAPTRIADWDKNIEVNRGTLDRKGQPKEAGVSKGILRNSVNQQWTIGAISKANYKFSDNFKTTVGIDWRTAEIDHFREVRDLLGGNYYLAALESDFWTEADRKRYLGDHIDYDNTNTVNWLGGFGQGEYTKGQITAYGMAGYSVVKYDFVDHFRKDASGNEARTKSDWIGGYQAKGGASYRINPDVSVFANLGFVSKTPIFDNVINDFDGSMVDSPKNENFASYEAGLNFIGLDGKLSTKLNYYITSWKDRAFTRGVQTQDGTDDIVLIRGMNSLHQGVELEAAYQPIHLFRLDAAASLGNWKYTDDLSATLKDYNDDGTVNTVDLNYYVKDLKVGDAPQTQVSLGASLFPINGLSMQGVVRFYDNFYADFDPFSRQDPADTKESWKTPSYALIDFHASYKLPFSLSGIGLQLTAHVFNVLDTEYIQDALDNSSYNAYADNGKTHSADDAEVYMGLPRTFNIGLQINY